MENLYKRRNTVLNSAPPRLHTSVYAPSVVLVRLVLLASLSFLVGFVLSFKVLYHFLSVSATVLRSFSEYTQPQKFCL